MQLQAGMPLTSRRPALAPWLLAGIVLLVCLLLTVTASLQAQHKSEDELRDDLEVSADTAASNILSNIGAYELVVRGLQAYLIGSDQVTHREFHSYVQALSLQYRLEGVSGIGLIAPVPEAERHRLEAAMRADGLENYLITPSGVRHDYLVVTHAEPISQNGALLGVDMATIPAARAAMERSRDSDAPILSPPGTLSGVAPTAGDALSMFVPVYDNPVVPALLEQRRQHLRGWILLRFRMDQLMAGLSRELPPDINVHILDTGGQGQSVVLYPEFSIAGDARFHPLQVRRQIEVGGREWTLEITPTAAHIARKTHSDSTLIAVTGLVLSASLGALTLLLARGRQHARQQFLRLFEGAPDAILIVDAGLQVLDGNPAATRMFGMRRQALSGQAIDALCTTEDRGDIKAAFLTMHNGSPHRSVWMCRHADGRFVPVNASVHRLDNSSFLAILHDISVFRQAEETRRKSEQRYRLLFSANPLPLWVYDTVSQGFLAVNDAAVEHFGYSRDEFMGMRLGDLHLTESRAAPSAGIETDARGGFYNRAGVWQLRRKDGVLIWVEISSHALRFDDRDAELILANDVTSRVEAEQRVEALIRTLDEQRTGLQQTIACMVDAIITIDQRGGITSFNAASERLFGYSAEDVVGKNVGCLMPEPTRSQHDGYLDHHLTTGERKIIGIGREVQAMHKDGHCFPMRLSVAELPAGPDGLRRFIGSCQDLTLEKLREEQLLRTQKMDALGQLTSGVSHDFNNVLGIINGYTEMLSMHLGERDPLASRYLEQIGQAIQRATRLTQKLLDFSSDRRPATQRVDANQVIEGMRGMLVEALTKSITLDLVLADELWPVNVDVHDLENSLLNMAINSRHAMPDHGRLSICTLNCSLDAGPAHGLDVAAGDYVRISLEDTGCGMPEDVQKQIFNPFFTTKGASGTGLGLAQVYGFVKRSGGNVAVTSRPGFGTRIDLYLPRMRDGGGRPDAHSPMPGHPLDATPGRVATVLIVDDEPALLQMTSTLLQSAGHRTLCAASASEALHLLEQQPVDLMLTDIVMPGMSGTELAAIVRERYPEVAIQLVSGYSNATAHGSLVDDALYTARLQKPVPAVELLHRVESLLAGI